MFASMKERERVAATDVDTNPTQGKPTMSSVTQESDYASRAGSDQGKVTVIQTISNSVIDRRRKTLEANHQMLETQ